MKLAFNTTLLLAAISMALTIPMLAQTSTTQPQQDSQASPQPPRGEHEAMRMVPAQVALKVSLDAAKNKTGYQFQTTLAKKITLSNGIELPEGAKLIGIVTDDDMNVTGDSKLVLRFTDAVLKNGETIPIRATIVGAYWPQVTDDYDNPVVPGREMPNVWKPEILAVDQLEVIPGIDLHSKIASQNSGVFVSTKGRDVKLAAGSELAIAVAPRNAVQAAAQPAPQQ